MYIHAYMGVGHAHVQALRNLIKCQNLATSAFPVGTMVNLRSYTRRKATFQHTVATADSKKYCNTMGKFFADSA